MADVEDIKRRYPIRSVHWDRAGDRRRSIAARRSYLPQLHEPVEAEMGVVPGYSE